MRSTRDISRKSQAFLLAVFAFYCPGTYIGKLQIQFNVSAMYFLWLMHWPPVVLFASRLQHSTKDTSCKPIPLHDLVSIEICNYHCMFCLRRSPSVPHPAHGQSPSYTEVTTSRGESVQEDCPCKYQEYLPPASCLSGEDDLHFHFPPQHSSLHHQACLCQS